MQPRYTYFMHMVVKWKQSKSIYNPSTNQLPLKCKLQLSQQQCDKIKFWILYTIKIYFYTTMLNSQYQYHMCDMGKWILCIFIQHCEASFLCAPDRWFCHTKRKLQTQHMINTHFLQHKYHGQQRISSSVLKEALQNSNCKRW